MAETSIHHTKKSSNNNDSHIQSLNILLLVIFHATRTAFLKFHVSRLLMPSNAPMIPAPWPERPPEGLRKNMAWHGGFECENMEKPWKNHEKPICKRGNMRKSPNNPWSFLVAKTIELNTGSCSQPVLITTGYRSPKSAET